MGAITVLIVDDHRMVAQAFTETLKRSPDIEVIGVAETGAEGIDIAAREMPDVVLMDFRLGDMLGTDATKKIRTVHPAAKIIMVTGEVSETLLVSAIEAGCVGYITKGSDLAQLAGAVRKSYDGEPLVSPDMLPKILRRIRSDTHAGPIALSKREREVLQLLSEGNENDQIASALFLSVHTVRTHIQNVIGKLGAHSKLEAVAIAVRQGLVCLD